MITRLTKHIEKVLLKEKCCVVPSLGGFVREDIPAHTDISQGLIMPPSTEIHFNESLNHQDGLIQQSYASTYALSTRRANAMVQQDVKTLKETLLIKKEVALKNIGHLTLTHEGIVVFTPQITPENNYLRFGLTTINLLEKQTTNIPINIYNNRIDNNSDKYFHIKISKKAVNIAAAVLGSIMILLPLGEITINRDTYTAGISTHITLPNKEHSNPNVVASENTSIAIAKKNTEVATPQKSDPQYYIVIASDTKLDILNNYVTKVQELGFSNVQILQGNKMNRVIYGGFDTASEAYNQIINLKKQNKDIFGQAWVYKRK